MIDFSGFLESDLRFIIEDTRGLKEGDGYEFQSNRNDLNFRLSIYPTDRVKVVIDSRFRFYGFSESEYLTDLNIRDKTDPWSLHLDEAYVSIQGVLWENLDVKIGRMALTWGTADQFNPTDNINARDFTDPLDYTTKVPNEMVEINMYPTDWLTLSVVWVPIFKHSLLPSSANLGFAVDYDDDGNMYAIPALPIDDTGKQQLAALGELLGPPSTDGTMDTSNLHFEDILINLRQPSRKIENSQVAAKAQFSVWDLDFSFSYYYGRFSYPVPVSAAAVVDSPTPDFQKFNIGILVDVLYPRMHVAGFDFSYSASWLFDIGIFGEMAVIFPEQVNFGLRAYLDGEQVSADIHNVNVPDEPFIKATVGWDYTFTSWLYVNTQYVRGFFDEFNDMYGIHNYWVMALEFKFLDDELQFRIANVLNCDDLSDNFFPQLTWIIVPSVQVIAGAFVYFGKNDRTDPDNPAGLDNLADYADKEKFGWRATGRSIAFVKVKVNW